MAWMTSLDGDTIYPRDIAEFVKDRLEELDADESKDDPEIDDPEIQAVIDLADEVCYGDCTDGDIHKAVEMLEGEERKGLTLLIAEDYFEDYAKDFARDVYGTDADEYRWPLCHIDWEEAAEALKSDFHSVNIMGTEYYYSTY